MPFGQFDDDSSLKAYRFRLATFKDSWPFLDDCSCTPEKVGYFKFFSHNTNHNILTCQSFKGQPIDTFIFFWWKKVWNICERDSWLELTCSICSDLRDLSSSPASVKVRQTAPRVRELLELCLRQSQCFFHTLSNFTIKFCHIVVSTMLLIKIEDTISWN